MIGNLMKSVLPILFAFSFLLSIANHSQAQAVSVETSSSSSHLVTAEITYVSFAFKGLTNYPRPANIELKEADMFYSHASADRRNGRTIYYLHYQYQAVREGRYEVPPVTFTSNVGDLISDKLTINVYSKDILSKKSADIEGQELTYYTLTKANKSSIFPNETTHIEYKVYLPEQLRIALWGLPLGEKKNCSAWRFNTPNNRTSMSRARIDGQTYQAGSFHTNLTSLKEGKASIGPLKGRVVFHAAVMTRFGTVNKQFETQLASDKLTLTVKPIPEDQPEHFRGDVGNYVLSAMIDSPSKITENDSVQIIAQLKGTGNLATVNPPLLLDLEGWKIISQNRTDLGDDRKSAKGIAEFTYLIQPDTSEKIATQTPSLLFVALDPQTGGYRRTRIPSKPITVTSKNPPPSKSSAGNNTDSPYDGLITSPDLDNDGVSLYRKYAIWLIHILPLGFILILAYRQLRRRLRTRRLANTEKNLKRQALADLEKVDSLFLKSAGSYVERWVDTDKHPDAEKVLSLRDSLCFRPDGKQDVSKEHRKKIIDTLRKCSLVLLFTFFLQDSDAAQEDTQQHGVTFFEAEDYPSAIEAFSSLLGSPENPKILYNIGLCHQLNHAPGWAAFYYHKALERAPDHSPSLKNLNYVETKNSSIKRAKLTDLEKWIQTFTPTTYIHIILFLVSIICCLVLTFIYLNPRGTAFRITIILCIFTPLFLAFSIYGYISHPDKSTYRLKAAIILEKATITTLPLNSSQVEMEAPPASRCHIIAQRSNHTYVVLANGVKGWIASNLLGIYQN